MTAKKKPASKRNKESVKAVDTLNTAQKAFAEACCKQEPPQEILQRIRRDYSELSDKYYPLRRMFFELESLVKLTGVIDEAIFDKVFVKHRVRF